MSREQDGKRSSSRPSKKGPKRGNNNKNLSERKKKALRRSGVQLDQPSTQMMSTKSGALEHFLQTMDDPDDWRRINITEDDSNEGSSRLLTSEELDIIRRVEMQEYADSNYDPYPEFVDFFTNTVMETPLLMQDEPKRRFVPSKWEANKVAKLVKAIRSGLLVVDPEGGVIPKATFEAREAKKQRDLIYDVWADENLSNAALAAYSRHISAPKMTLPTTKESYNPPEEYLIEEGSEEMVQWEKEKATAKDQGRLWDPLPRKVKALRLLPAYERFVEERNSRCHDLFLCPRAISRRVNMRADDLLPILPDAKDLGPYPSTRSIDYIGHEGSRLSSISVDPTGNYLVSASTDGKVCVWDVQTGRAIWKINVNSEAASNSSSKQKILVSWNPNKVLFMFALCVGAKMHLVVPPNMPSSEGTWARLQSIIGLDGSSLVWNSETSYLSPIDNSSAEKNSEKYVYATVQHASSIRSVQWHRRGDYLATLVKSAENQHELLAIHQLSKRLSQYPLVKAPTQAREIAFHPARPQLFILAKSSVRVFDLSKRTQIRKLNVPVDGASSLAVHSSGDHLIVGGGIDSSMHSVLCWFDLDAGSDPYRVIRGHQEGSNINSISISTTFPLLASAGSDSTVNILYGQVYADLSADPKIVPLASLKQFGSDVTDIAFHPTQPWLFCGTAAGTLSLYV